MDKITIDSSRRRPRFHRTEYEPSFQLTDRDVEIIRQVARHRFLRSTHLTQLLNASHKKICERLTPLYHAGYLDRPRAQLDYYVRGGGSAPLVYALGNRGSQLLATRDGFRTANIDWTQKNKETGREFILHTLAVSDFRVALAVGSRAHNGITLQHRDQLLATLPDPTRSSCNPWAWRVRVHHAGAFQDVGLSPDYTFALFLRDGRRRPYIVECDRGTMPVERTSLNQTSMLRKFLAYEAGRLQSLHERQFGWKNFRVLIVTESHERANNMRDLVARTSSLRNSPLFLFTDNSSLAKSDVLTLPWRDPLGKTHFLI